MDSFTTVENRGCLSNIGGAVMGVFIAPLVLLAATVGLFANEKNAVNVSGGLAEGKSAVVHVDSAKVDPANQGKLVHMNGTATSDKDLQDDEFGVRAAKALRLDRHVEMYQWVEKKETHERKKVGGGTEKTTTYTYSKEWSDRSNDSSGFKQSSGHQNPQFPVAARQFKATPIHVGAFTLPDDLVDNLKGEHPTQLPADFKPAGHEEFKKDGSGLLKGSSANPQVGDTRITWEQVDPGEVSLLGKQTDATLSPYVTKTNTQLLMLEMGHKAPDEMFAAAESANQVLTWIIRVVCWIFVMVAFGMVLGPLEAIANVIPLLGDMVGFGAGLFGFVLGTGWTMLVIAVAWIAARPLLGCALLAGVLGLGFMAWKAAPKPRAR